jgi:hypothetical protein
LTPGDLKSLPYNHYTNIITNESAYRQIIGYPHSSKTKIFSDTKRSNNAIHYLSCASPETIVNHGRCDVLVITGLDEVLEEVSQQNSADLLTQIHSSLKCFIEDVTKWKSLSLRGNRSLQSACPYSQASISTLDICCCLNIFLVSNGLSKIPGAISFLFENKIRLSDDPHLANVDRYDDEYDVSAEVMCLYGRSWFEQTDLHDLLHGKDRLFVTTFPSYQDSDLATSERIKHVKRMMQKNKLCVEKESTHETDGKIIPVHWSDIGGLDSVREEIMEVMQWPLQFKHYYPDHLPRYCLPVGLCC